MSNTQIKKLKKQLFEKNEQIIDLLHLQSTPKNEENENGFKKFKVSLINKTNKQLSKLYN